MTDLSFLHAIKKYERELEIDAELTEKQAGRDIKEPAKLREIIDAYELQFHDELARIMREIDRACKGDEISRDAVLTACSHIEKRLLDAAIKYAGI